MKFNKDNRIDFFSSTVGLRFSSRELVILRMVVAMGFFEYREFCKLSGKPDNNAVALSEVGDLFEKLGGCKRDLGSNEFWEACLEYLKALK